jgi:hypothetical protein
MDCGLFGALSVTVTEALRRSHFRWLEGYADGATRSGGKARAAGVGLAEIG